MSDDVRERVASLAGLVGLVGIGIVLVLGATRHQVAYGTPPAIAGLVVATGLLVLAETAWIVAGEVPVRYERAFGAALASGVLLGIVGVVAAFADGTGVSINADGARIAFLAGVGANVGVAAELQSGRVRLASRRADRAESTAERLSEERSRFAILNETTRKLLQCQDRETVAKTLVDEGRVGLPGPFAGVWLYEADRDRLVPAAVKRTTPDWEADQLWPDGDGMQAFQSGESRTVTDDNLPDLACLVAVPIGEHGLLVVGDHETIDERARDLAEVYAQSARSALDRIDHEQELERQNERLEAFASAVAHDLRNPLGVIRGRARLVRETEDPSHLEAIDRSANRMETIIDDLLELARGGDTVVEANPVGLADLVRDAWANVDTDQATLELGDLPTVDGDRDRLGRLFENLFRNAVEHGGSDVTVEVGPLEEGGFYVADDGPGIPPGERDDVLQEGYSGSDGTGLGLAIVRQIAEAHGWWVKVTEGEAGGARFEFRA